MSSTSPSFSPYFGPQNTTHQPLTNTPVPPFYHRQRLRRHSHHRSSQEPSLPSDEISNDSLIQRLREFSAPLNSQIGNNSSPRPTPLPSPLALPSGSAFNFTSPSRTFVHGNHSQHPSRRTSTTHRGVDHLVNKSTPPLSSTSSISSGSTSPSVSPVTPHHVQSPMHLVVPDSVTPPISSVYLPSSYQRNKEIESHDGRAPGSYNCRKCNASFFRRDELSVHMKVQHRGDRPFQCDVCGFRFIKKDHAVKHWRVVHLKERPFKCKHCDSRFGQRSDLNKHHRSVHLRIKPFECTQCGLRFSHRGNQLRHQTVVHDKQKPFTCQLCPLTFAEKSNLLKHCHSVHKMTQSPLLGFRSSNM